MRTVVPGAVAIAVVVVVTCALFTHQTVSPSRMLVESIPVATASGDGPVDHRTPLDATDGTVDLYGNEISDAVATYSLDPGGSLYEVHSPQTELPHLASPKS